MPNAGRVIVTLRTDIPEETGFTDIAPVDWVKNLSREDDLVDPSIGVTIGRGAVVLGT